MRNRYSFGSIGNALSDEIFGKAMASKMPIAEIKGITMISSSTLSMRSATDGEKIGGKGQGRVYQELMDRTGCRKSSGAAEASKGSLRQAPAEAETADMFRITYSRTCAATGLRRG